MKNKGRAWLATVLVIGFTALGSEQTKADETGAPVDMGALREELQLLKEETVSVASRYEQPISETPSNVYVITDEDIRHSGVVDLPTVLRRIPGIEVMQTTGADFNVSARGDNQLLANKMLVLVDGRSIYVDTQATVFWKAIPVTLPEIKRIEVLIGPASAIYGFNAFDGVINIITKSPEEMKGTTLQIAGGEFGTLNSAAIHAGTYKRFGYRLSLGRDQNNQWDNRDALAFRAHKFNVHTEYALSTLSRLVVSGGLVDANRFDGPLQGVTTPATTPALGYAQAVYERPNSFVRAYWNRWDFNSDLLTHPLIDNFLRITNRDFSRTTSHSADSYNIEAQHAVNLGMAHHVIFGFNYRHNALSSSLIGGFLREDRLGFYLQDEWKPIRKITVIAGARYDLDTFINPTISPRAALLYNPTPDHTFRVGVSVAYRPPTLNETAFDSRIQAILPPPIPLPPVIISRGSENLHPEEIVSYEAGYQGWYFKHRLRLRTNLFFNHISDLIIPTFPRPIQGGEADIYGGEAGVEFLATRWLTGFANYAYQEIGQTFEDVARRGAPRSKFNAGLRGEWDNGFNGEVAYYYYGAATYPLNQAFFSFVPLGAVPPDARVGSYNLLTFRLGYRFWKDKAEVALSAFNALNDKHKEHPLGEVIGSRVLGWLTLKL